MISSDEMLVIVNNLHAAGYESVNYPRPEEILKYKVFEKVYLNPQELKTQNKIWQPIVDHYAHLNTDFPPIVVDENNKILDGEQRVAGAQKRGDSTIVAYKPVY